MILLHKNTANEVVVTLTENATKAHFLFEFTNDVTKEKFYFIGADQSAYPSRYNKFSINTSAWQAEAGFYTYRVYEQDSAVNTDPALAGAVVEVGKARLLATEAEQSTYTQYNNPTNYTQYGY